MRAARRPALWLLRLLAALVVRRRRPIVVGITGSVGKTTTKDLIASVLAGHHEVGATTAGGERGSSLTALGATPPGRDVPARGWLKAYARGIALLARRGDYPEVLVLEMSAGRPGEVRRITRALRPHVAVVLAVDETHLEYFGTREGVADEKAWLVRRLQPGGTAVLNADDPHVRSMSALTGERVLTFGRAPDAHVRAEQVNATRDGLTAKVDVRGHAGGVELSSPLLGERRLSNVLAALSVAHALGTPLADALGTLAVANGPAGRLRAFEGRNGMTLLDDTYNATPPSVRNALGALRMFPEPQRAVIGELGQLGTAREAAHSAIAAELAPWLDDLVTVGPGATLLARLAVEHGMDPARVVWASDADAATRLALGFRGGTLLVNGENRLGLDRVSRALVREPAT